MSNSIFRSHQELLRQAAKLLKGQNGFEEIFLEPLFLSRNLVTSIEIKTVFSRDTTHASKFVFDFFSKDQL